MRKKRVLAGVLTATLVLGSLTLPENISFSGLDFGTFFAQAAEIVDSGTCGDNLTWTRDEDGLLTISGTGEMDSSNASHRTWRGLSNLITEVKIESGVTNIESNAFFGCGNITKIEIPDSVTSIGEYAFNGCGSLTSIDIPNSVNSIGEGAFCGCSSLASVEIPDCITSIADEMFSGCSSLPSIEIPDGVTSIGEGAFSECSSLTSIKIPDNVTSIEDETFSGCSSLPSIDIPNSVTSIGEGAFSSCDSFTNVEIPDSVISIGAYAFSDCEHLTSIDIPNSVISIGERAFSECTSLTSIEIPDSVTSIGDYAFSNCSDLMSIEIPDSVTSIGDCAFQYCSHLTSIEIPDSVTSIGEYAFYSCSHLTSIKIPYGVTKIQKGTFDHCTNLIYVEIPDSVTSIEDYAFRYCTSLKSIKIPDGETIIRDHVFSYCYDLKRIEIPESVAFVEEFAFYLSENLTDVYYHGSKNEWNSIVIEDFNDPLTSATIHCNTSSEEYGDFRYICLSDTEVEILKYFGSDTEVEVPSEIDGVTVTSIGDTAFLDCADITSVILPDGITYIGDYAFSGCTSLVYINSDGNSIYNLYGGYTVTFMMPSGLLYIGDYAFEGCRIAAISLTNNIVSIGEQALNSGINSFSIYFTGTKSEWDAYDVDCDAAIIYYLTDFTLGVDNNSYLHSKGEGGGFYGCTNHEINSFYFTKLTQYSSAGETASMISKMYTSWNGSCYGVAATIGLLYSGIVDIGNLCDSDAASYYKMALPCEDDTLLNNIEYYYLSQFLSAYSKSNVANSLVKRGTNFTAPIVGWWQGWDSEEEFWEKLVESSLEGNISLLSFDETNSNGEVVGHTVLVTGCAYDVTENCYLIQYYDENTTEFFKSISVSEDFSTVSNFEYIREMSFIEIDRLSDLAEGAAKAESAEDTYSRIVFIAGACWETINSLGESLSYDGSTISGDMSIYGYNTVTNETTDDEGAMYYILDVDSSETYEITCLSDDIDVEIYDNDNCISLSGTGIDSATLSLDDGIEISGTDYDFTVFITTGEETEDGDVELVSISATASSGVSIQKDGENIVVTSDDELQDVVVANYSGVDKNEVTLEETATKLTLTAVDESVVVNGSETSSTDTNHDYNTSGEENTNQSADIALGDINGDDFIDYLDAMTALRYDAELVSLSDDQLLAGDVNGDSSVDSLDAILILRYDAGLIENF